MASKLKGYKMYTHKEIFSFKEFVDDIHNINIYEFNRSDFDSVRKEQLIENNFPFIYILKDDDLRKIYVGETNGFFSRMNDHISKKRDFNKIYLIGNKNWSKNTLLNIENELINIFKGESTEWKFPYFSDWEISNGKDSNNIEMSRIEKLTLKNFSI